MRVVDRRSVDIALRTILFALILFGICLSIVGVEGAQARNALSSLKFGTGWINLGDIDIKSQKWATLLTHRLKTRAVPNNALIPISGDILEITMQQPVVIVGYASQGEENRLMSPAGRPADKADLTGVILAVGTNILVVDVASDPPGFSRNLQGIWVRVVEVPPK